MHDDVDCDDEYVFSDEETGLNINEIHVRKQIRKGRKWLTTVEGIPADFEIDDLLNRLKRELCCNGNIDASPTGQVIVMQGDHGRKIVERLADVFPNYKVSFHGN
ncbi:translation initiation factor 1 [Nematocida homosporus]|uniref:translation initiation factor 1 n=1 Tax=Nematocida homosporus TaxID=1912981 RepID=UPI00221F0E44|nr:translation initiation factor 1 [Nematocida homosporus]KAI5185895.1 translation initiation factor 1 [Nematocida homosporus]